MATIEKIKGKIIILSICAIISLSSAENVEVSEQNKIEEENPSELDAATRNARYISHQGNPYYYQNTGAGGYYYPNNNYQPNRYPVVNQYPGGGTTQFYPERHPNKFDPNYWLSKLPGIGNQGGNYPRPNYPQPNYPQPNYPNYIPGTGTDFIGFNPYPSRYPGASGYPHTSHPQSGYPGYSGSTGPGYSGSTVPGYSGVSGIGYSGSGYSGQHGNGGYGGYQGNGGLNSYSGYDGYYAAGNRPGNIGFGYQNSRTNGIIGTSGRYPNTLLPIATPSSVSKDAK